MIVSSFQIENRMGLLLFFKVKFCLGGICVSASSNHFFHVICLQKLFRIFLFLCSPDLYYFFNAKND